MGYLKQIFLAGFLGWLVLRIVMMNRNLRTLGFGIPVFNHSPGPCKVFHVNGSEDIAVLPNGLAVISSGVQIHAHPLGVDPAMLNRKGVLYLFDMNNPNETLRPLSLQNFDDSHFGPHGIDIYTNPTTHEVSLFVVNHAGERHTVEIFDFDQENMVLKHKKTVADEKIYSPNDVLAIGPDSFYITNDRYFKNKLLVLFAAFYPLKLENVVFYNGSHAKFAADRLHLANGINMDASGKFVFVVSGLAGEVHVFERTEENDLIQRQVIDIGMGLDNVDVDENGNLWLGVANFAYVDHNLNFTTPCPGKALLVNLSKAENGEFPYNVDGIREVFSTSGDGEFKCVSSASYYRGNLLIGNPHSNLMYCKVVHF